MKLRKDLFQTIGYIYHYVLFTGKRIQVNYEALRDNVGLRMKISQFSQVERLIPNYYQQLLPDYHTYTTTVSPDTMAISLETAAFLLSFCQVFKPQLILDLGSGFSSFIFRVYAREQKNKVWIWSVDDNKMWLKKTKTYLIQKNSNTHFLISWQAFCKQVLPPFDLIFHDLGTMQIRIKTLPRVLKLIHPLGFVILDDMHFPYYEPKAKQTVSQSGFNVYSLRRFTVDNFRRYASMAMMR